MSNLAKLIAEEAERISTFTPEGIEIINQAAEKVLRELNDKFPESHYGHPVSEEHNEKTCINCAEYRVYKRFRDWFEKEVMGEEKEDELFKIIDRILEGDLCSVDAHLELLNWRDKTVKRPESNPEPAGVKTLCEVMEKFKNFPHEQKEEKDSELIERLRQIVIEDVPHQYQKRLLEELK